jgi:hypothetical protein
LFRLAGQVSEIFQVEHPEDVPFRVLCADHLEPEYHPRIRVDNPERPHDILPFNWSLSSRWSISAHRVPSSDPSTIQDFIFVKCGGSKNRMHFNQFRWMTFW